MKICANETSIQYITSEIINFHSYNKRMTKILEKNAQCHANVKTNFELSFHLSEITHKAVALLYESL